MLFLSIPNLLLLIAWTPITLAIIGGEQKQWNRFGFLVKVFSREQSSNIVTSCTGSIISGQLVLTSSQCLLNSTTGGRLSEFVVTVPSVKNPKTMPAEIIEVGETWGILKIPESTISNLCPPAPAPKRVAQLNVRPSLVQSSIVSVDPTALKKKKCWVVGFATSDNATEFIKQDDIRIIDIESVNVVMDKPSYYWSPIVDNETACWDDAGAALFCSTRRWGHMLVGIFQHLVATKLAEKQETAVGETTIVDSCSRGVEMRFSKTADQMKIFETIQKFDLASFINIYDTCFREVPYNLTPGA